MSKNFDDIVRTNVKYGGIIFAGTVIELGMSFVGKVFLARYLSPADFGALSLGITTLAITSTVTVLGLKTGLARYIPQFDDASEVRSLIVSSMQLSLPLAVATGIAVVAFAPTIAARIFNDPGIAPVIRTFGLAVPLSAFLNLTFGVFQGEQRTLPKALIENVTLPAGRFLVIVAGVLLGAAVVEIAVGYVATYALGALVGVYLLVRVSPILDRSLTISSMRRELLAFSAPILVSSLTGFIFADMDTIMLGYFAQTSDVGIYNVMYPIAQMLGTALMMFAFIVTPVVSELHSERAFDEIERIYRR